MNNKIQSVTLGSPADKKHIRPGDIILKINNNRIHDILDYKFYSYDSLLHLEVLTYDNKHKFIILKKAEGEDLGLSFESYLMDSPKACQNKCIFCFVDQLPHGLRKTLYFKDDDARLSFLQGNYITLSNLSEDELNRIGKLHLSPINISVHTTNPELRCKILGNKNSGNILERMQTLADFGIVMNCQIVCCPDWNDSEELQNTMNDLLQFYPYVPSVSIVPVGLTSFREKLTPLKPFDKISAEKTVYQIVEFGDFCIKKYGTRIFFPSDELFIKAGLAIPDNDWYEDYPQLENGVGLIRLLLTEFSNSYKKYKADNIPFTVATGEAAYPFINSLYDIFKNHNPHAMGKIIPIRNDFFGHTIDVAGLITGRDIIKQLKTEIWGNKLLIPRNMLRAGENYFLDDISVNDIERELNVKIRIVEQNGNDVARAFSGN